MMLSLMLAWLMPGGAPGALPAMEVPVHTGERVQLADWRGEPVIVTFWATWCGACREELAVLGRLSRRSGWKGQILAVAVDSEGWKTVLPFLRQQGYQFPVTLLTPRIRKAFEVPPEVSPLPRTIVYGRDGREVGRFREAVSDAELMRKLAPPGR